MGQQDKHTEHCWKRLRWGDGECECGSRQQDFSPKAISPEQWRAMRDVLAEVEQERLRQHAKWGEQNHPDGTGRPDAAQVRDLTRRACQENARRGTVTWRHILEEEVTEALAETDPAKLRAELVQVAAVAVQWIEVIDRRPADA